MMIGIFMEFSPKQALSDLMRLDGDGDDAFQAELPLTALVRDKHHFPWKNTIFLGKKARLFSQGKPQFS